MKSATGRGIVSRWENGVGMDKKKNEKKSAKSSHRTPLQQKRPSPAAASLRSVDDEGTTARKPKPKRGRPAKVGNDARKVGADDVISAPAKKVDVKPPMPRVELREEASSPQEKTTKRYDNETPEERKRRHAQYVRENRRRHQLELARLMGFQTIEEHKLARRQARLEKLIRAKVEMAKTREAYSKPSMSGGDPHHESASPYKRKPRKKKYPDETPEERTRRLAQYIAEFREKQKLAEAQALGFATIEEHKLAVRLAKQEKLDRAEIEKARNRGAYSKLTLVRRALASLAEALNAEFNKPLTKRGDFREIEFRIQHLANIKQILS